MKKRTYIQATTELDQPYLFVSYARTDTQRVEAILNILYRRGFRIWYDEHGVGISTAEDWYETIMTRIDQSAAFLAFISNATEYRPVVIKEITKALRKKEIDPDYRIVFVFLEKVSAEGFPPRIRQEMRKYQFIDFQKRGGVTESLIRSLNSVRWPDGLVDQAYRKAVGLQPWVPLREDDRETQDSLDLYWRTPVQTYRQAAIKQSAVSPLGSYSYYALSPEQLDRGLAYPIAMDNQWIPQSLYDSEKLYQTGLTDPEFSSVVVAAQRREILRSLLHNWNIIVNRASILNSRVFFNWYDPAHCEYDAFRSLIRDTSIIVYLFKEDCPTYISETFDVSPENRRAWTAFCRDTEVCCLRLDWESEETNRYETSVYLTYPFHDFCLSLADDDDCLRELAKVFRIPDKDPSGGGRTFDAFVQQWRTVQDRVISFRRSQKDGEQKHFSREQFYRSFLVDYPKNKVQLGILDRTKGVFVPELKQVIDFYYALNLPLALGIQPQIPLDSVLTVGNIFSRIPQNELREIQVDELTFAVSEFHSGFLRSALRLPVGAELGLGDVAALRGLRAWREYLRAVTEVKKRSHLEQLDFTDIEKIWTRFRAFLRSAERSLPAYDWEKQNGALSIIYYFGETKLVTVYEQKRKRFHQTISDPEADQALNRKCMLRVNFVFCDVLLPDAQTLFTTEYRLFEGKTHQNGVVFYRSLLNKLLALGFESV